MVMLQETEQGAYLGAGPNLGAVAVSAMVTPNFDVFDGDGMRLLLGKCSRLPDDEDPPAGRYGIDFHRALPTFDGQGDGVCDWGEGAIPVTALNYARYLPRTLKFREFTATLAFAARTPEEYRLKARVYTEFYRQVYKCQAKVIAAVPHSGNVQRPPDAWHPYPHTEIDAWTARVAGFLLVRPPRSPKRVLLSLHSTDYIGFLVDIGDFGLSQNQLLPEVVNVLQRRYESVLKALLPAYREHITPYTVARWEYFMQRWGTLEPERLSRLSTAVRFEMVSLARIMAGYQTTANFFTLAGLRQALEKFWDNPPSLITLNGIFSGRKTARLLRLAERLPQAGLDTALQVEVSRFLARDHPELAAAIIRDLLEAG